jgi:hypothetical protein
LAANNVNVRMSAENAEMVRAWLEAKRGPEAFSQELDKIATKGQRAGQVTKTAFQQASGAAMQVVGALTGVGSAVGGILAIAYQLKAEYQALVARQKEAADAQVSHYESVQRAGKAYGAKTSQEVDALNRRVIGGANGVKPSDLLLAIESGISASGDVDKDDVVQMVLESARRAPEMSLSRRQALVTGALMTKKGFPEMTTDQALAVTEQSFIAARTEDVTDFGKNVAPGVAQMAAFGGGKDSHQYLTSLAIAMGQRSGDPTGRRSMNATINMLKQVKEETLAAGLVGPDASVEEQINAVRGSPELQDKLLGVFAEAEGGADWKTKLEAMRANKRSRGDLGGDLHGEAKSFIAMVEMLSPGANKTKAEFESAMGKVDLPEDAVRHTAESRRAIKGSQAGQAGEIELIKKQADQSDLLLSPYGQQEKAIELMGKARQIAGEGLTSRGLSYYSERATTALGGKIGLQTAEETAERLKSRIGTQYSGEERANKLESMQGVIDEIKALRADLQAAKDKPQPVAVVKDGAGNPQPAAPGLSDSPWDLPSRGGGL